MLGFDKPLPKKNEMAQMAFVLSTKSVITSLSIDLLLHLNF